MSVMHTSLACYLPEPTATAGKQASKQHTVCAKTTAAWLWGSVSRSRRRTMMFMRMFIMTSFVMKLSR